MIFVKKRSLVCFLAITVIFFGALGIASFICLSRANAKYQAELIFFCTIVSITFLIGLFIALVYYASFRTKRMSSLLNRLNAGGYIDMKHLESFGAFGSQILNIINGLQEVSQKRVQRITFLNEALSKLLLDITDARLFLGSRGTIIRASLEFFDMVKVEAGQDPLKGSSINRFQLERPFSALAQEMAIKRDPITVNAKDYIITFTPVFSENEVPDGFYAVFRERKKS